MSRPLALFRVDASAAIGSGHVRRCLSVAAALKRDNWMCRFAVAEESLAVVPELATGEFEVRPLSMAALREARTLSFVAPNGCDLLIIDHYGLDRAYETGARDLAQQVMVIDDLADRDHDCDVLVDGTPGRSEADYVSRMTRKADLLLGSAYAPLRAIFATARTCRTTHSRGVRRLLVSFGGTDPNNTTGEVIEALACASLPEDVVIDVVVGAGTRHAAKLVRQASVLGPRFRLHLDTPEIATLLTEADVAIGAGGVSAMERCCVGLPSVVLTISDNQMLMASSLAASGSILLARDATDAARQAFALLNDKPTRRMMSRAGTLLCDGRGAQRIACWISPERAKDGRSVRLRPASANDEAITLRWQTQPETRRFARNARIPTEDEHRSWFAARHADPDCLLNIVLHDGESVGTVRLDRRAGAGWEVSIAIDATRHGNGIGRAALALARRLVPEAPLLAGILPGNRASLALFARAGYVKDGAWYVSRPH